MKRTRKIISVILALIMMLCMSPLSGFTAVMSSASQVTEDIAGSMSDVIFDVPETIYLKPETSNTASVFQYYVDRGFGEGGLLRTGENTTGNIFFNCADATSVGSVTCRTVTSTGTINADITSRISLSTSAGGSNTRSITIMSGSLQNAISAGSYQTLRWTINYCKDGKTCTATNYSVCYSPFTYAAATATSAGYNGNGLTGYDFFVRQTTWIAGVHNVQQATTGDWQGSYSITSPLIDSTAYYRKTNDEPFELFLNNTGTGAGGYCKRDESVNFLAGKGYVTVDTSRYSNLNGIPNLQCGMDFNGLGTDHMNEEYSLSMHIGAYLSGMSEQSGNIAVFQEISDKAGDINDPNEYNYIGRHGGYKINLSPSGSGVTVRSEAHAVNSKDTSRTSAGYVNLFITPVDKSTLRGMIGYAVAQGYQASDYTSESWASYELQLQKACEQLGQVTNTDITTTALDNAINGLVLNTRTFTISFDMNGGTGSLDSMQATTGSELRLPDYTPERDGWDFKGWSTDQNDVCGQYGSNQLLTAEKVNALCPEEGTSVTLYAIWYHAPKNFTVSFDMNSGTGSLDSIQATTGSQLRVPNYQPNRDGYSFLGWSTDPNATTIQYGANQLLTVDEVNALCPEEGTSVTLYAVWYKPLVTFTISLDLNGGTGLLYSLQVTTGSQYRLPNYSPDRSGYDFLGWAADPNATSAQYESNQLLTVEEVNALCPSEGTSVTLYAVWYKNPVTFTISFNMNGGSGPLTNVQATAGSPAQLPNFRPGRSNYYFMGWSTDQNAEIGEFAASQLLTVAEVNAICPPEGTSTVTLYAIWVEAVGAIIDVVPAYNSANDLNTYTIGTLGGTVTGKGVYECGEMFDLIPTPAAGYRFDGWFMNNQYRTGPKHAAWINHFIPTQEGPNCVEHITARFCVDVECYDITTHFANDESSRLKQYYFGGSGGTVSPNTKYMVNDTATITATASLGYYFDGWYSGYRSSFNGVEPVSTNPNYSFTVTEDAEFTARFSVSSLTICGRCNLPYNLTEWVLYENEFSGGTVQWRGTPGKYNVIGGGPSAASTSYYTCAGGTMKITAAAYAGYTFVGWYSSMAGWDTNSTEYLITTNAEYTFTMPAGNPTYYARFDLDLPEALYKTIGEIPEVRTCFTDESVDALQAVLAEVNAGTEGLTDEEFGNLIGRLQDAIANLEVRTHEVNVPDNCTSTQADVDGVNYKLATITAPQTDANGNKFVYWTDSYGNIVSTYRTYRFYVGNDADYTPVYASAADYDQMKADALISSRVIDVKNNRDGNLVFLAEHSVSGSTELIGHGMIITTDESAATDELLVRGSDNDDIIDFQAQTTKNSKTGMIQVCATVSADTVWARTYVVDSEGVVHYGLIQSYNVSDLVVTDGEEITLDGLELITQNGEEPVEEEPAEEPAGIFTMLLNFIRILIQNFDVILKSIISLVK